LIRESKTTIRCTACQPTLVVQRQQSQQAASNEVDHTAPSSHVNYRYLNSNNVIIIIGTNHFQDHRSLLEYFEMMKDLGIKAAGRAHRVIAAILVVQR
jgi:hypothetical protein